MLRIIFFPLVVSFSVLLTTPLFANDASMTESGSVIMPIPGEDDSIKLVEENLSFDFQPDGYVYVKVMFRLKNESGVAVERLVGFPDEYSTYKTYYDKLGYDLEMGRIEDFNTFLDGTKVEMSKRQQEIPYDRNLVDKASKAFADGGDMSVIPYPYNLGATFVSLLADLNENMNVTWYCWKTTWQPNQTRQITNTYRVEPGSSVLGNKFVLYTLITGATWNGSIGKLVIDAYDNSDSDYIFVFEKDLTAQVEDYLTYPYVSLTPDEFKRIDDKHIQLVLEDFEPSFNAYPTLIIALANESYFKFLKTGELVAPDYYILPLSNTSYIKEQDISGLTNWGLTLARNEIYARHGRKFGNKDLRQYFESQTWYLGQFDDVTAKLNKFELFNASFILDYQKKNFGSPANTGSALYKI